MTTEAQVEKETSFRVPSQYKICRRISRQYGKCAEKPVADMKRSSGWWAYCATHLGDYNREVREDRVWWRGH